MNKTVVQFRGQARAGVPPGTRLNDLYEVGEQIAQGGMGEIYRGSQIATGDPVAIKMIKPEFAGDESVMALFHREASALNRLQHESIVRYYIFGTDRAINRTYLAMEFVEGSALSDIMSRRALSSLEVNELRRRIAAGLQVAHDNGIVHRDISPDNIIMPDDDVRKAKIIDFGIARSTKPGQATVIGDGFAGKYNYVSPEQAGMFGGDVTPRSDIYSLGLLLVAALQGKPIEMGGSMADVIEKRRSVPDLSGVDKQLRPLLERMLAPDPQHRPASMAEVAQWTPKDKTVRTPSLVASGAPTRTVSPLALSAAAVLLVSGGIGAFMFMGGSPAPQVDIRPPTLVPGVALVPPVQPAPAVPTAPAAPERQAARTSGALGPDAQVERIINYVRYYDADPCLYLKPLDVTNRTASVVAMSRSADAVKAFEEDFRDVNGFDAVVRSVPVPAEHCEAVAFLHRLDSSFDPAVNVSVARPRLRPGESVNLVVSGAAGRSVNLFVIDENGSLRNLSSLLKTVGLDVSLNARLDEAGKGQPANKLLLAVVSSQPLPDLPATAPRTALDAIAREIRIRGGDITAVPQIIQFEQS